MIATAPVQAGDVPSAAIVDAAPVPQSVQPSPSADAPMSEPAVELDPSLTSLHDREVIVKARSRAGDPLQSFNVASFKVAQGVDRAIIAPTSKAYRKVVPQPIRSGFGNFINNLRAPVVFVNFILQLKLGKAAETAGRFAINTTVGVVGVFDIAKRKPFRWSRRRNSFGNTLGFYGVKPGPFFFAPLVGPTTLRDLFGDIIDQAVPVGPVQPIRGGASAIPIAILTALDYRSDFDGELERQRASDDPYTASKEHYLARRQAEIDALRGRKRTVEPQPAVPAKPVEPVPEANLAEPIVVPEIVVDGSVMGPPA